MPALEKDTKLVMTILFVGAISGTNVYFYAKYGSAIAFNDYSHALVFGLMTIGAILSMKALFDLALNDKIEMVLLDRRIAAYWAKKNRDAEQRERIRQSMQQYSPAQPTYIQAPPITRTMEENRVPTSFLAQIEQ
jgi:hypothetical protein